MIACLRLIHWAAAMIRREDPALLGQPLVIGGQPWESAPAVALSAEVQATGARVGMPLKQVWALCPTAHFLLPDEIRCREAYDTLLDLLWTFSDRIAPPPEPFWSDTSDFYLDLGNLRCADARHLAGLLHDAVTRLWPVEAHVGLASGQFVAQAVASSQEAVKLVPAGEEAAFLAPLSVNLLPLEDGQAHRLALLGIRTLGQFAALPASAMLTQFGMRGPLLHRLALGVDDRPLEPIPCPRIETLTWECEPPVDDLQLVEAILRHLSEGLASRLGDQGLVCPEVQLSLELRHGELVMVRSRPREPVSTSIDLLRLLLRLLDQATISGPVYSLEVHLRHLQPAPARQLSLFGDDREEGRITPAILERLAARHGRGLFYAIRRIGSAEDGRWQARVVA